MKVLVIGAGIFGVTAALRLSSKHKVTLVDMNDDILLNASKHNHNRLHYGFHYPRSAETAQQSLEGYVLFHDYFKDEIIDDFENYYMIEKTGKIDSKHYENFCDSLKLKYKKQFPKLDMNFENIESSYLTNEPIFDYIRIKSKLVAALKKSKINLILNKKITSKKDIQDYDVVINTTYFNMNKINKIFDLPQTLLKLQTVIIPNFKWKHERIGITIMDGPFCSILPKGGCNNNFLLYHVEESVVYRDNNFIIPKLWYYGKEIIRNDFMKRNVYDKYIVNRNIKKIVKKSAKYFPFLSECDVYGYWQTVRALPINDNDERLSTFDVFEVDNKKVISVLSGKITTCFSNANNINELL